MTWVCTELERRITEALTVDSRITEVTDFEYETGTKKMLHVSFTVHTVYGDIFAEKEVNI